MRERGLSFKEALNSGLGAGLTQVKATKRPFTQKPFSLGPEQNFRWDKALAALTPLGIKKLPRKLSLRK
jgi:hypothetical protein